MGVNVRLFTTSLDCFDLFSFRGEDTAAVGLTTVYRFVSLSCSRTEIQNTALAETLNVNAFCTKNK